MRYLSILLLLLPAVLLALTVGDVTTSGRTVDGNSVSDYDEDGEQPVFGNIENAGSGNTTITWSEVTTDTNGNPVTIHNYEIRYKEAAETVYTTIVVPPQFVGHSFTLSPGSYSGFIEAVTDSGYISTDSTFTFEVP